MPVNLYAELSCPQDRAYPFISIDQGVAPVELELTARSELWERNHACDYDDGGCGLFAINKVYNEEVPLHVRAYSLTQYEAEKAYKKEVNDAGAATVLGIGAGWFWGTDVPGDRNEAQIYMAGIPTYKARTDQEADAGYPNLVFTS